jgi:hypothetical protein
MKKKLNQKDIDRFQRDLADFLGVRRYGGCLSKKESDEKTELFFEVMRCLKGKPLLPTSHNLNVNRHLLRNSIFVHNPAYYRRAYESEAKYLAAAEVLGWAPPNEMRNKEIVIVPEENIETALLFGFPNLTRDL